MTGWGIYFAEKVRQIHKKPPPEIRTPTTGKPPKILENLGESDIIISKEQLGKKIGKHIDEWGFNPQLKIDREQFEYIIYDIVINHDQPIRIGNWRGHDDEVLFYIKGDDVVVTKQNHEFITILKDGVNNVRVKNAREYKIS